MLQAKDIMTPEVITVSPEMSLPDLSKLFIEKQKNGFPVVDSSGKLIGVVTEKDLIDQNKQLHMPTVIALFDAVIYLDSQKKFEEELKRFTGTRVEDICSRDVITVAPDTPLSQVASIMAENSVHTLPVVEAGRLVGVIGKRDVIRGLAQS